MRIEQQLLARITPDDREALVEVAHFLRKAEHVWNRIDGGKQCELNAQHHDDGSLALCLRRAMQAADELIEASEGVGKR
ncbi:MULTISPECIES: hypothetical protein [Betaproteobacteria]|jgi:hypothetical protein|uniref:Uncharacterized protein n=1 Tax=Acidovorax facilis TaxID=12917 RepID=A0ABV8DBQ1_9BURK|nr:MULTISPECIES: hypothetical protein [Acidovorax]KQB60508.1 hypothetical protein AE621_04720 [Acidovorax sp. SD340]MBO1009707.1 hypothetical protein [Acidovorax sp. SD340]MCO4243561.1 hypothetical protein [Acidovorax facilis]